MKAMTYGVKEAIAKKLTELYPQIIVYDEKVSQLNEGGFFIYIKKHDYEKKSSNKYQSTVLVEIEYYPSTEKKMNEMEEIKLGIFRDFDLVEGFRIQGKTANMTEDRLYINMTIKYEEVKNTEPILMQRMTSKLENKED